MKRFPMKLTCVALLVMLLAASLLCALAQSGEGAYVVETVELRDRLNVHSTPSMGNIIDHLEDGTVVMYQYSDDGWWHVEWWKGHNSFAQGYVDGKYLVPVDQDSTAKFTCVDNLYVHSQPEIVMGECSKYHIDQLKVGEKVNVVKQSGTWSLVEYDGGSGWVSSIYLVEAD